MATAPAPAPPAVPTWFDRLAGALVSAVAGVGVVGALLAAAGWFQSAVVLVIGLAAGYTLFSLREGFDAPDPWTWAGGAPAAAAVAVAAAAGLLISLFPAEPLLPGPKAATILMDAASLPASGTAGFDAFEPVWRPYPVDLAAAGYEPAGDRLDSAGPPMAAALAGSVHWLGQGLATRIGALTAAVALLAGYGLAARLLRPWLAVVVVLALAVNPAFVHLARDGSPALPALGLVAAALALLWDDTARQRPRRALLAGALAGLAAAADIAWLLLALPLVAWLASEQRAGLALGWTARQRHHRFLAAFAVGYAGAAALGLLVAAGAASGYVDGSGVAPGWVVAGIVVAVGVGAAWPRPSSGRGPATAATAALAAAAVLAAGAYFGVIRPATVSATGGPSPAVAAVQEATDRQVDATRTYAEDSGLWQGWYAGPVAAVAGVGGLALLAAGRGGPRWRPVLFVVLGTSLLWLLRPGVDPIHVGVMARFLLTTFGLLLGAGWLAGLLWSHEGALVEFAQATAIAVVAGTLLLPAWFLTDTFDVATQRGATAGVAELCGRLGPDAAVLVVGGGAAAERLPAAIRRWCDVPVAAETTRLNIRTVRRLSSDWADSGRRLLVLSEAERHYRAARAPDATRLPAVEYSSLEPRVDRRPNTARDEAIVVYLSEFG